MDSKIIMQPIIKTAPKSVNDKQLYIVSCVSFPSALCALHPPLYSPLLSLALFQSTSFVFFLSSLMPLPLITQDF